MTNVQHTGEGFRLALLQRPPRIMPEKCTGCGSCMEVCPSPGALARAPGEVKVSLKEETCRYFSAGSCSSCVEACPEHAIVFSDASWAVEVDCSAVVLATGFKPFDPSGKPQFGYGRVPGVLTAMDLEALLRHDNWSPNNGNDSAPSVAFIQCVGSRDVRLGRNYCSRVCCGYAMRLARLLMHRFPEVKPSMFYMDIQSYDRDFEQRLAEAAQEVRLIRAMPAEVRASADGSAQVVYHGPDDSTVKESFDMVVLSVGISPQVELAGLLGMRTGPARIPGHGQRGRPYVIAWGLRGRNRPSTQIHKGFGLPRH